MGQSKRTFLLTHKTLHINCGMHREVSLYSFRVTGGPFALAIIPYTKMVPTHLSEISAELEEYNYNKTL